MTKAKDAHTLVSYFVKNYKEKYGFDPVVNRYAARWGFDALLMDMSVATGKELIDYYFETTSPNSHTLEWFFYNYDKLAKAKKDTDKDVAALAVIREDTRKRTEEWRKKQRGNN